MSDLMFYGLLEMPYEMAMGDEVSRLQFYGCVQEAVRRLKAAEAAKASAVPKDVILKLGAVYGWMVKLPVPTDGIIPKLRLLETVIEALEGAAPQAKEGLADEKPHDGLACEEVEQRWANAMESNMQLDHANKILSQRLAAAEEKLASIRAALDKE